MAKNNTVEVKFAGNTFNISKESAKNLALQLKEEVAPAKPIKHKVHIHKKLCDALHAKIKGIKKDIAKIYSEHERLMDLYENKLTPDDEAWLDAETMRLGSVIIALNELSDKYNII